MSSLIGYKLHHSLRSKDDQEAVLHVSEEVLIAFRSSEELYTHRNEVESDADGDEVIVDVVLDYFKEERLALVLRLLMDW